jgi:guanylate kinase
MKKKGFLVTIVSPSGGGKSTICGEILKLNPFIEYSISTTTRAIRGQEIHGKDYYFTDIEAFERKIKDGYFIEYAKVHGNYYGTSKEYIDQCLKDGKIIILDIDVQGVELAKKKGYDIVTIFVLPPSHEILRNRLNARGTDTVEVINKRMENAVTEIGYLQYYDYLVINDDIKNAIQIVNNILTAEMNKYSRYVNPVEEYFLDNN